MTRFAQACITNLNFPETVDQAVGLAKKNSWLGPWLSDMDVLLDFPTGQRHSWTAPRWLTEGDVLFFYHAITARQNARRVLQTAQERNPSRRGLLKYLRRANEIAERLGGCIFAAAIVTGATEYQTSSQFHFGSRVFAPFRRVLRFRKPLLPDEVRSHVAISRQSALTPLCGRDFDAVMTALAAKNHLPKSFRTLRGGQLGFRNVQPDSWRTIACADHARFIHEAQIRAYLIDYLLNEVRDARSVVLQECRCNRGRTSTGIADYFVRIGGVWVPVEAKLNAASEPDLLHQVQKYTDSDSIVPLRGARVGQRVPIDPPMVCFVIDQTGLHLYKSGQNRVRRVLDRVQIGSTSAKKLKDIIAALIP